MNENRAFFTPARCGALLALLIFATFPQVLLGLESFVARDFGFFVYPLAHFQRDCFWHGRLPLWDPYNNCGVPFLAQWNTMPLYPPALVYLLLPLTWGLNFFCLLHLWFAGLGMYFLARRWTGHSFAATFAAVAFCFNGMTLNLLMWPSHLATLSWMPWVVLAVESAWRNGGRKILLAALAGALQMLAGGPELIFFTWILLLALWILQLVSDEFPRKFFWRFPAIVLLIIALAAAQLLPFLDLAAHSQRQAGYADLRWSMPGTGWINLLVPMFAGHTGTEGIFFQPGQYWTSSYYLGLGCLWLALVAVIGFRTAGDARRKILLLAALAAVAFIFALGENTPVLPALRRFLPQLALVTYPVKYFLLVTFIAPLLAAFGLSRLENLRRPTIGVGIVLALLIAAILAWLWKFQPAGDETRAALLNGWSRLGFLAVIAAILVGSMKASGSPLVRITTPLLLAVIAWVDVLTHEPTQNPTVTPNVFAPNLAREDLKMQPQPELGRSRAMVSPKAYLGFIHLSLPDPKNNFLAKRLGYCANCNLLDSVPKVDGFFSLSPREYDDVFSLIYSATNEFDGLENFLGVSQITAPDQVFHWRARTNYLPLVTAGQLPVFLDDADTLAALAQPGFDGSKVVFLPRDTRLPMSITNRSNAQISGAKFDIDQVQFDAIAAAPALVVVAQSYDSNWRAFVDGRSTPLLRANDAFQAVEIAPGKHQVKLKYNDRAFEIGAAISLATLLFFLGVLALPRKPA